MEGTLLVHNRYLFLDFQGHSLLIVGILLLMLMDAI